MLTTHKVVKLKIIPNPVGPAATRAPLPPTTTSSSKTTNNTTMGSSIRTTTTTTGMLMATISITHKKRWNKTTDKPLKSMVLNIIINRLITLGATTGLSNGRVAITVGEAPTSSSSQGGHAAAEITGSDPWPVFLWEMIRNKSVLEAPSKMQKLPRIIVHNAEWIYFHEE
jgi:hypothetical protein